MVRNMRALWDVSKGSLTVDRGVRSERASSGWVARFRAAFRRCLDWFVEY